MLKSCVCNNPFIHNQEVYLDTTKLNPNRIGILVPCDTLLFYYNIFSTVDDNTSSNWQHCFVFHTYTTLSFYFIENRTFTKNYCLSKNGRNSNTIGWLTLQFKQIRACHTCLHILLFSTFNSVHGATHNTCCSECLWVLYETIKCAKSNHPTINPYDGLLNYNDITLKAKINHSICFM